MDHAIYGRTLMGDSLGFHIIFALLGVGIPFMISLVEFLGIWKGDSYYMTMAKRWSFLMGTLFVVGGISGLIISNQLTLLWPPFMTITARVVGPAFYMEAFAFFIEAIFLGIYLYSWEKFKGKWNHWLCSLPLVIASVTSAFFITTANAWMNDPAGFTYINGVIGNVHPLAAIFNPATFTETTHSIVSYYLTTALSFAGVYSFAVWKNRRKLKKGDNEIENQKRDVYFKKIIVLSMWIALIFTMLMGITGDDSARFVALHEPVKFAAAENVLNTGADAPLKVGGIVESDNKLHGDIEIPGMLSILVSGTTHTVIMGLNAFNPDLWPPLWVHYMFDGMVGLGTLIGGVVVLFFFLYFVRRKYAYSALILFLIFISAISSFFAVEFGWVLTEVGRQPYAIRGILTTAQSFTTSPNVELFGFIFPTLYLVLFIITPWILVRHYKKFPLELPDNNLK